MGYYLLTSKALSGFSGGVFSILCFLIPNPYKRSAYFFIQNILMRTLVDFILHIDVHLAALIAQYGTLTYAIIFGIIFIETGVVIMPFLPGDSMLFAAGALAAQHTVNLDVHLIFIGSAIAAILGDTLNYHIGKYVGPKAFSGKIRFLKKEYMDKTQAFFEKYGWKAIIFARFVPIIRTFAPFVAGIGSMSYKKFIGYNILGGILWTGLFTYAGYFFGNIPFIKNNFSKVVILIILVSILPIIVEWVKNMIKKSKKAPKANEIA